MKSDAVIGPGLKVPPPTVYLAALLIGLGIEYFSPTSPLPSLWGYVIGTILIIASILIMPPVLIRYKKSGTPFDVRKPARALIADGPYKYSRNPSYVSLTLLYLGLGVVFNNGWVLVFVVPVVLIMDLWVIRSEERHLEAKFGEEYLQYKSKVRRWL